MYFTIGAVFCIGFVVGMAFGMVRGKKELMADLKQSIDDLDPDTRNKVYTNLDLNT